MKPSIQRLLLLCLPLFACQGQPTSTDLDSSSTVDGMTPFERESRTNEEAWREHGEALAQRAAGQWVLIAGGVVHGPWEDFESAEGPALELAAKAQHAYFYRPGVDDLDVEFPLSPFLSSDPHWQQLGIRQRSLWQISIAAVDDLWWRDGHQIAWGDAGAKLELASLDGLFRHQVRTVASGLFEQDLTLTAADARALGGGRFFAPGSARYFGFEEPCQKTLIRMRIPELAIDGPVMAFVLPASLTNPD